MTRRGRLAIDRDQDASPFSAILWRLCEGCAAHAAAFVDREGETVDYAGRIPPYEIRVAAAELRLVFSFTCRALIPGFAEVREIRVRTRKRSYAVVGMGDGYAIVLELARHAFTLSPRALVQALRELELESGIQTVLRPGDSWCRVEVRETASDKRRPDAVWLGGAWHAVTVLGRYRSADLAPRERGYLARIANGAEFSLVREPLGFWYSNDLSLPPPASFRPPRA